MPVQLRLLDDESQSRRSLVWSQLPEEVRATLVELLAKLLLECVQSTLHKVRDDNESR
jgi:cation transport regulator ChaB